MSGIAELLLVLLALAGAAAFAAWTYLRREPPVRGRVLLSVLRAGSLVLLVLLFWNPAVPFSGGAAETRAPGVLLDASLSMGADPSSGPAPWEVGVRRATEIAGSPGDVLLFGSSVRRIPADSLEGMPPTGEETLLAPALERAAALGATSVDVVSDFRLEDPVRISRVLEATGLGVRYVDVGIDVANAGIVEASGPASLPAGEEGSLEVLLGGDPGSPTEGVEQGEAEGEGGGAGRTDADSVDLELRLEDRLLASLRVPLPSAGRTSRHRLSFRGPEEEGLHRLRIAALLPGDGFEADDEWIHYLDVEDGGAGLVFLSLRADWEPRYLLPVLEQVTGLEGRGFLLLGDDRWLPMGRDGGGDAVDPSRVRELAEGAEVLVIQGLSGASPAWVGGVAASVRRLVVAPRDPAAGALVGVEISEPRPGEWYVSSELPSSPLAGELAGATLDGLPPLTEHLRLLGSLPAEGGPLLAREGRQGRLEPVLALLPGEDRRSVVLLASGLWRWAARDGAPRETYRRLWSGVAAWLFEEGGEDPGVLVEPARLPAPRGRLLEWRVWGVEDSLDLRITTADGPGEAEGSEADRTVLDTTVVRPGSTLRTPALPPGRYRYVAGAAELPGGTLEGELEVGAHSPDLLHPRVEPPGAEAGEGGRVLSAGPGRPLRTHPVPYLLLLLLLCAEWIGRRRQGLR